MDLHILIHARDDIVGPFSHGEDAAGDEAEIAARLGLATQRRDDVLCDVRGNLGSGLAGKIAWVRWIGQGGLGGVDEVERWEGVDMLRLLGKALPLQARGLSSDVEEIRHGESCKYYED